MIPNSKIFPYDHKKKKTYKNQGNIVSTWKVSIFTKFHTRNQKHPVTYDEDVISRENLIPIINYSSWWIIIIR
jgi:hypothetical protein